MKLLDLRDAINSFVESYGEGILDKEIYFDGTFDNEIMIELNDQLIATVCNVPSQEDYKD